MSNKENYILILVMLLTPISQLSIDIYAPSLPFLANYFHSSNSMLQWSISIYLIGVISGQAIFGNLASLFGIRLLLITGLTLFIISSITATYTHDVHAFLLSRLCQGVGISGTGIFSKSITRNIFSGEKLKRLLSYMATSWGICLVLAPILGSQLQQHINWKANFYFLSIYGLILLFMVIFILPKRIVTGRKFQLKALGKVYCQIIKNASFLIGIICMAIGYLTLTAFTLIAPFIWQSTLRYSVTQYGYIALVMYCAYLTGTYFASFIIAKVSLKKIICCSFLLIVLIALCAFFLINTSHIKETVLLISTIFVLFFAGILYPVSMSVWIESAPANWANEVNVAASFIFLGIATLVTSLISSAQLHSPTALINIYLYLGLVGLTFAVLYAKGGSNE